MSNPGDYYKKKYKESRRLSIELKKAEKHLARTIKLHEIGNCSAKRLDAVYKNYYKLRKKLEMAEYVGD